MFSSLNKLVNSDNKKRLLKNFSSLFILRGLRFIIPLITLPYLVRTIGMDNYGLINFALSLGMYFGTVIQFGFNITATREIAKNRNDILKIQHIFSATISAALLLVLISSLVFVFIVMFFDKFNIHLKLYLFTLLFIIFQNISPLWFFQGMEKMKYITYLNILSNVFFLGNLFVFVKDQGDFIWVPLLNAVSSLISFIFSLVLIKKQFNVHFIIPKFRDIKLIYINGAYAFINQLAPNLYNASGIFILGLFTNNSLVGSFAAARKVIDAINSFAYILSSTFLPFLSRSLNKHTIFQKIMLLTGCSLSLITMIFSHFIVNFLFGSNNIETAMYIKWLSVTIIFSFVYLTYNTNYLMISGNEKIAGNISLYISLIAFLLTFILIYNFSIWGAVVSIMLSRGLLSLTSYFYYLKVRDDY